MEKIMRPRYEERFDEFRLANHEKLVTAFEEALEKLRPLKKSRQTIPLEVYDTMETLFWSWGQVRTGENMLDRLLSERKYLFVAWMASFALCTAATGFPDVAIGSSTLAQVALYYFGAITLYSVYYVWRLFELDERLSKFKGDVESTGETLSSIGLEFARASGVSQRRAALTRALALETRLAEAFTKQTIPYEMEARIKYNGGFQFVDFAIPSAKKPVLVVETKWQVSPPNAPRIRDVGRVLKASVPNVRTLLVVSNLTSSMRAFLARGWDDVFDETELERLVSKIKESL
jgi:hypothetical protein